MSDDPHANQEAVPAARELYTPSDMLRLFAIDAATLWRWRKADLLPAPVRIGRRLYWLPARVWQHLDRLHREAQPRN